MQNIKEQIISQFIKLTFQEKKQELLETLKKLYWESEIVNKLWNIVYSTNDKKEEQTLIKIHEYLLDAIFYTKDKQKNKAIESIKLANESFSVLKKQEEKERLLTEKELDSIISSI